MKPAHIQREQLIVGNSLRSEKQSDALKLLQNEGNKGVEMKAMEVLCGTDWTPFRKSPTVKVWHDNELNCTFLNEPNKPNFSILANRLSVPLYWKIITSVKFVIFSTYRK